MRVKRLAGPVSPPSTIPICLGIRLRTAQLRATVFNRLGASPDVYGSRYPVPVLYGHRVGTRDPREAVRWMLAARPVAEPLGLACA